MLGQRGDHRRRSSARKRGSPSLRKMSGMVLPARPRCPRRCPGTAVRWTWRGPHRRWTCPNRAGRPAPRPGGGPSGPRRRATFGLGRRLGDRLGPVGRRAWTGMCRHVSHSPHLPRTVVRTRPRHDPRSRGPPESAWCRRACPGSRCTLRRTSGTESPPNFSVTASATTSATMASATTPAAGTAHTSLRWWIATPARRSRRPGWPARAARWRSASSRPGPAAPRRWSCRPRCRRRRFDRRVTPGWRRIDLVVGLGAAAAGGGETVTDLDALDRLDAHQRGRPAGSRACGRRARTSRAPAAARRPAPRRRRRGCRRRPWRPRSRRSSRRWIAGAARAPARRRWRPGRPAVGSGPSTASPSPMDTTWETTSAPSTARRNCWATVPSATRAAVSRAEARSSTGRASSKPYFCMPARSA